MPFFTELLGRSPGLHCEGTDRMPVPLRIARGIKMGLRLLRCYGR